MGQLLMVIGAIAAVIGAVDFIDFGDDDVKNWKKSAIKIIGGLVIVGVGALINLFGL